MYYKIILLLFSFSFLTLSAQQFKIEGTVEDDSGNAVIGATAALKNPSDSSTVTGAISKVNGKFIINASQGNYYLKISSVGLESKFIDNINLNEDKNLGKITLAQSSVLTDEIVVSAEKEVMELKLDKRVYNVDKDASNRGRNASEMLDNIPSVNVDPEGNVSLRGSGNVRILINGKQSGLVGSDPEALRQLMGNMVEKIEIITNPSARYDAQGEVGIINIVLKKDQEAGYNGSFETRTGFPDNHALSVNSNYRSESTNLFASIGTRWRRAPGFGNATQTFFEYDTFSKTTTNRDQLRGGLSANIRLGSDFYLPNNNMITFSGQYRFGDRDNVADITYTDYLPDGDVYRVVTREDNEAEEKNDIEFNLTYEKQFNDNEDHKLMFDSRFEQDKDLEESNITQTNTLESDNLLQRSSNLEFERNQLYQLDYIYPFSEDGKFEAGAKATLRKIDNDFWVKEQIDGEFQFLDGFNNNFLYYENIYAAYVMAGNQYDVFGWQLGLRSEYSDITTELVRTDYLNQRDYLNFFPTAHFNFKIDQQNSLQASYSARIQRPYFRRLMPFSSFTDPRNFYGGNPDLNPEYTDSFEAGYLYNWEGGSILSNVYYRYSTGLIQTVTFATDSNTTILRPANIGTQNAYGLEFNLNNDITDWWEASANFNLFRATIDGAGEVEGLNSDFLSWNTRLTSNMDVLGADFQLNFNYRAPQDTPQGRRLAIWWVDFGISKDILDNNATITLSGQDIFSTRMRRLEVNGETFYFNQDFQWRSGQVTLTFSYRINQQKQRGGPSAGMDD